jgi:hypothetical protein
LFFDWTPLRSVVYVTALPLRCSLTLFLFFNDVLQLDSTAFLLRCRASLELCFCCIFKWTPLRSVYVTTALPLRCSLTLFFNDVLSLDSTAFLLRCRAFFTLSFLLYFQVDSTAFPFGCRAFFRNSYFCCSSSTGLHCVPFRMPRHL